MGLPTAQRIVFREMTTADLDLVHSLLGDPQVMAFYPRPKTLEECALWIRRNRDSYAALGFGLWILEDLSGRFLGECGLILQDINGGKVEVGYHLSPSAQGRGYAAEAARACIEFAREKDIGDLIAIIDPANAASRAVALSAGMSWWRNEIVFGGQKEIYRIVLSASAVSFAT
ncbi:RimJ/RimL family protein N-acetyltransferase [Brevibacterium sanguinis]|uniref:RimJ/RimL family protein N-acetyltransferase n=2 Tax=Brevibacterium TaxID=1696 RepID=A0A366II07_9MICO|nr:MULTISPECIES: GNAT family N-acetyltransferase [Brevibacterium]RBP63640.1 RimJ/RimL family protein N-acetyltransferase [Brevibacterium sanguinis]RBP70299.1 RimJ/RimL family protein N-acetyltransferase [Brevibacterium celere]